jgi:hypothetical protein
MNIAHDGGIFLICKPKGKSARDPGQSKEGIKE